MLDGPVRLGRDLDEIVRAHLQTNADLLLLEDYPLHQVQSEILQKMLKEEGALLRGEIATKTARQIAPDDVTEKLYRRATYHRHVTARVRKALREKAEIELKTIDINKPIQVIDELARTALRELIQQ